MPPNGNVSQQLATEAPLAGADAPFGDDVAANESFARCREHLGENKVDLDHATFGRGPTLAFDPKTERFTGAHADAANALAARPGRAPFRIPVEV